jgi:hypothetical protein
LYRKPPIAVHIKDAESEIVAMLDRSKQYQDRTASGISLLDAIDHLKTLVEDAIKLEAKF